MAPATCQTAHQALVAQRRRQPRKQQECRAERCKIHHHDGSETNRELFTTVTPLEVHLFMSSRLYRRFSEAAGV